MNNLSQKGRYILVGSLGAVLGGFVVLLASRAVPKMMAQIMPQMMAQMMRQMSSQMGEGGCNPEEM